MRVLPTLAALTILASGKLAFSTEAKPAAVVSFEVLGIGFVQDLHSTQAPMTPSTLILPTLMLAHSETELRRILTQYPLHSEHGGPQAVPAVDFDRSIAVLFLGARGSTCNPYHLARVLSSSEKITLHVIQQMLGKNCVCASMIGDPYILARIPRTDKPIGLEIETETHACS